MGTAVATTTDKAEKKPKGFAALMARFAPQMEAVLPRHLTAERMIALLNLVSIKTPALKECADTEGGMLSLFGAIMNASRLGLEIGSQAHLLPFKNNKLGIMECVMVPDYRGLADLARRANPGVRFNATCVFEGDEFEYELGLEPKLIHRPSRKEIERTWEKLRAAYAIARLQDGTTTFEVLEKWEIQKIRASSRAKDAGPWVQWFDRMAMKSVMKRLVNLMQQSPELVAALEFDNRAETGEVGKLLPEFDTEQGVIENVRDKTQQKATDLSERIAAQRERRQTPPEGTERLPVEEGGAEPQQGEEQPQEAEMGNRRDDMIASLEGLTQAELHKKVKDTAQKVGLKNVGQINKVVLEAVSLDSYQAITNSTQTADVLIAMGNLKQPE